MVGGDFRRLLEGNPPPTAQKYKIEKSIKMTEVEICAVDTTKGDFQ